MRTSYPTTDDQKLLSLVKEISNILHGYDIQVVTAQSNEGVTRTVTFSYLTHSEAAKVL